MADPLFVGSNKRKEIIKTYLKVKLQPSNNGDTVVRRVVKELGTYKLNSNNSNSFVATVIRDFNNQVREERESNGA